MQSIIKINDYPRGSGKTTSMIEGFRSDRKCLVIVPLLTEVDRVVEWSKSKVSIEEFDLNTGYMTVDTTTGLVSPKAKWWSMREDFDDTLSTTILNYGNTGCLYLLESHLFIWPCPRSF